MGRLKPHEQEVAHGYSLEDIHRMAESVMRTHLGTAGDLVSKAELYDTAFDAMMEALMVDAKPGPAPATFLLNRARWRVINLIKQRGREASKRGRPVGLDTHWYFQEDDSAKPMSRALEQEDFSEKATSRIQVGVILADLNEVDRAWVQDYMDLDCNWAAVGRKRGVSQQRAHLRGSQALEAAKRVLNGEPQRS